MFVVIIDVSLGAESWEKYGLKMNAKKTETTVCRKYQRTEKNRQTPETRSMRN